jgi:hypothetical protein
MCDNVEDKVYGTKVTGVEDPRKLTKDVITAFNIGMLARTWAELEFRLYAFHETQSANIELRQVNGKKLYVRIHQIKLISYFSCKFITFK